MKLKKKTNILKVSVNKIKLLEESDSVIKFNKPLIITDNTEQHNGTSYDIASMKIEDYRGLLTIDHSSSIKDIVGKVIGLQKSRNKITIEGIDFAIKENAMAQFAKDMFVAGNITDFSIETIGTWPDDDGVWKNSSLVGLSMVIAGNNKSATVNQLVMNSISKAQENGLDVSKLEETYLGVDNDKTISDNDINMLKTVKNSRNFSVDISFKNAAGEESTLTLNAGQSVDVSENQVEAILKQINEAVEKKVEVKAVDNGVDIAKLVADATAPIAAQIEKMKNDIFDNSATVPTFKKELMQTAPSNFEGLSYMEVHEKQINLAMQGLKGDMEASRELRELNMHNLSLLKKEGVVSNSITIGDMGNFVISPELLKDIEGHRSDFSDLLSKLDFKETLSTRMAWLSRNGDIDMQEVEMCEDDADGNLKPITEYGATLKTSDLKEVAGVTPVCDAATRFLAVDLLGDVAAGYRNDYDRKRAQLFIARAQQAVDETGKKFVINAATATGPLNSIIDAAASVAENLESGTWIFNTATYYQLLKYRLAAGANTEQGFALFTDGANPSFLGRPYVVVPNELMPTLNTTGTKSFVVDGVTVTINQAMFYMDLSTFTGRTSGGLKYDLSTEAAYEVGTGESREVRSAYQRNELVLRGSFFRGGAIKDVNKVASLGNAAVS